jgi:8-oxo-dGTP pyrophosphatase MutT (NUDIX family)
MPSLTAPTDLTLELDPYRGPEDDPSPRKEGWVASVALVLRPAPGCPELLLIKRARLEGDPWSGHMALPGGRKDPKDLSLLHTARRETREEVALPLDREGRALGGLDVVGPVGPHLPPLTILPLVFSVSREVEARVASAEVAEIHWTPLDHLRSPDARTTHRYLQGEAALRFPALDVNGRTVWGLTHRILEDFLGRLR